MNILFISSLYPAYPGHSIREISYALHNFVKVWNKSHNVIVMRPYFMPSKIKKNYKEFFELDDVKIYNIPVYRVPKLQIFFYNNIIKKIESLNFNPEKLIAHMSSSFLWAYKVAKYFNSDFIPGIHNSDLRNFNRKKYISVFESSYKIACRSKTIKDRFVKLFPEYEKKLFIANSGISKDEIESKEFFREKILRWKKKKKIKFITVSLLQKLKNIDINLIALSELKNSNWEYIIIGDGDQREYLEDLVKKLHIENKVKFLGMRSRKEALKHMKESDVFIMISAPETFGLAYLEAMAKGNIIIGAKGWGIDGIIENGINGFLVEPRNKNELKNLLEFLFESNYNIKEKILENSYSTILKFTEENVAQNYLFQIK